MSSFIILQDACKHKKRTLPSKSKRCNSVVLLYKSNFFTIRFVFLFQVFLARIFTIFYHRSIQKYYNNSTSLGSRVDLYR